MKHISSAMFSRRAALPLLRARTLQAVSRSSITAHPRWYAKNNNQKVPYRLPNSPKSSRPDRSQETPSSVTSELLSENQFSRPSYSPERTEPDRAARDNAAPTPDVQPQKPLPDLTKGIPTTLAAEFDPANSTRRGPTSLNLTEDPSRAESADGGGGGDVRRDAYISSLDRRRARFMNLMALLFLLSGIAGMTYLGRNWETENEAKAHPDAPSGWGLGLFYNRVRARLSDLTRYYRDPSFEKLLPDDDPQLRQPYTLVLSLEDLLVHSEWTREHGWRVAKRPGVDYFLRYLTQYYEIVLFTSVPSMMAEQVYRKLDPYRIIRWPLFREATKYKDGEYIKDLSYLNRDLSKVILIDTVEAHARAQPENAIVFPKWKGDPKDKSLVALIPFLEYLATMGVGDVRPVLKTFEGKDIAGEFAKREKAMREKFETQLAEEQAKKPRRGVSSLPSLLGFKRLSPMDGETDPAEGFEEGKMLWDQIRERGQKNYLMLEKDIQENGEKWLAEMAAEEEKAMQEHMKSIKGSLTGFFGLGGNPPK